MISSIETYCDIVDHNIYRLFKIDSIKYSISKIYIKKYRLIYPGRVEWIDCNIDIFNPVLFNWQLKLTITHPYFNIAAERNEISNSEILIWYRKDNDINIFQQYRKKEKENVFDRLDQLYLESEYYEKPQQD